MFSAPADRRSGSATDIDGPNTRLDIDLIEHPARRLLKTPGSRNQPMLFCPSAAEWHEFFEI
jgi:hypothetical protein